MFEWLAEFTSHAMHMISHGDTQDLAGLFLVGSFTELGIPFPMMLDTVLFLLGYRITALWIKVIIVMLVLLVARETGSAIVYWLFHTLGSPLFGWLKSRFPSLTARLIRIGNRLATKASLGVVFSKLKDQLSTSTSSASGLKSRVPLVIALARLTPGLLTATSVASGIIKLPYGHFALGTAMASLIDDSATIILGVITGYVFRELNINRSPWFVLLGVVIDIVVIIIIQRIIWRRKPVKT
jgi:membrane protein DedA with SNARE-associated domain